MIVINLWLLHLCIATYWPLLLNRFILSILDIVYLTHIEQFLWRVSWVLLTSVCFKVLWRVPWVVSGIREIVERPWSEALLLFMYLWIRLWFLATLIILVSSWSRYRPIHYSWILRQFTLIKWCHTFILWLLPLWRPILVQFRLKCASFSFFTFLIISCCLNFPLLIIQPSIISLQNSQVFKPLKTLILYNDTLLLAVVEQISILILYRIHKSLLSFLTWLIKLLLSCWEFLSIIEFIS